MPWTNNKSALKHTRRANTPKKQRQWRAIANRYISKGYPEGRAITIASGVLKRSSRKRARKSSRY